MSDPDAPSAASEERRAFLPLLPLFFLSGAAGLIYEVLWMRRLTLVFGATQLAVATVLAAFMLGLALGAAVGGRVADRRDDPLRLYGLLEVGIGLYALAFPRLVELATGAYRLLFDAETVHYWSSQALHLVLMGGLVLLPTAAMGATLPLIVRFASSRLSRAGSRGGLLYGINTAGAVAGVWAAGFALLPTLGVRRSELLAAGLNFFVAAVALAWAARLARGGVGSAVQDDLAERREEAELLELSPDPDLDGPRRAAWVRLVPWVLGISGAASMVFEVAWTRFLALILGSSVYAFTLMLVAFLMGHAGGSIVASSRASGPGSRPTAWLAGSLAAAGLSAFATNHLFRFMPFWYVDLYALIRGHDSLLWFVQGLLALLVMTPATFFLGLLFPFAFRVAADSAPGLARSISRVYTANTIGAVLGSLLAGFVLIPLLGIQTTILVAVVALLLLAAAVTSLRTARAPARRFAQAGLGAAVLLALFARPPWDPLLMSAGMYKYVSDLSDYSHEAVRNFAVSDYELLFYEEGRASVVTVARSLGSGNVWLANNGKVDASTTVDMPTQVLLGHLPLLVRPDAKSALVVGLASGVSAGSVTRNPGLERIDVLEIEPAVIEASHLFDHVNGRPLDDPRVTAIGNDARNHLVLTDRRYDLIVNEPSNPWITGVSNLFTREYLELGRSRMTEDGVFVQWAQIYGMGRQDLRTLLKTFATVFPHVLLFSTVEEADLILLGSDRPLLPDLRTVDRHLQDESRRSDLSRIGVRSVHDVAALLLMDREAVLAAAGDAPLNTDDNVRIEFSAPLHLHYATQEGNLELLLQHATGAWPVYRDHFEDGVEAADFLTGMGEALERREQWVRAAVAYRDALLLRPDREELRDRVRRIRDRLADAAQQDRQERRATGR